MGGRPFSKSFKALFAHKLGKYLKFGQYKSYPMVVQNGAIQKLPQVNKRKFYAVLSHFAKCRNLRVKSAPQLPKIEGGFSQFRHCLYLKKRLALLCVTLENTDKQQTRWAIRTLSQTFPVLIQLHPKTHTFAKIQAFANYSPPQIKLEVFFKLYSRLFLSNQ